MRKSPGFSKVLIANRGEIAVRIARSARGLGYPTVAVFSDADRGAPHVACCDEAVHIGPAPAAESYLAIERILEAASRTGADAVHPGYGFLAENADFARACRDAGLTFVGPAPEVIELMGDKARAKARMAEEGVPSVPGYDGSDPSPAAFARAAEEIGYPVLVKAAAGGGGRGMRRVDGPGELAEALERARSEAESAFGRGDLLIEKLLAGARHVEVQVFGDVHGRVIHLGERDCSVQRRHQKVIEESPSPAVDSGLRRRMGEAAAAAGRALGYTGAGTVEMLLTADREFFFIEMNTRLQVEHAVTELVTGLDLVALQLEVAAGAPLPEDDVVWNGHAIEARLYAEDPASGYLPRPGTLLDWRPPAIEGVRVDHALRAGIEVTGAYDPMIAKLVAHGRDREQARRRLLLALASTATPGLTTNRRFLMEVLRHPAFVAGEATTDFLDRETSPEDFGTPPPDAGVVALAAVLLSQPDLETRAPDDLGAWRSSGDAAWPVEVAWDGGEAAVRVTAETARRFRMETGEIEVLETRDGRIRYAADGHVKTLTFRRDGGGLWLEGRDWAVRFQLRSRRRAARPTPEDGRVLAPMSGRIRAVHVSPGDACEQGRTLMVLEAMKLETPVVAPLSGRVTEVLASEGDQVDHRQLVCVLEPL